MRLIDTSQLKFKSFRSSAIPPYAILSHTWSENEEDEVSFQDFQDLDKAREKVGFSKIQETCRIAREKGLDYAWIDTCCIDKSSNAELTESINSMYEWYQRSNICIAYIDDWLPDISWEDIRPLGQTETSCTSARVEPDSKQHIDTGKPAGNEVETKSTQVKSTRSLRWFTRGWTLQELIAPADIEFYDRKWDSKGLKADEKVAHKLADISGIDYDVLKDGRDGALRELPLGQRMSWASHRNTSRVEDIAYCLLGIFQVNMPLLYGEGGKAFLRLQDEIIKSSNDLSLFAWQQHQQYRQRSRGVYAYHPKEFAHLRDCVNEEPYGLQTEDFSMTNKGLKIHTSLCYLPSPMTLKGHLVDGEELALWPLNCYHSQVSIHVLLQRINDATYVRIPADISRTNALYADSRTPDTIYICRDYDKFANERFEREIKSGIQLDTRTEASVQLRQVSSWPPGSYDRMTATILTRRLSQFFGYISFNVFSNGSTNQIGNCGMGDINLVYWGYWANLFCGLLNRADLEDFMRSVNPLSQRITALQNSCSNRFLDLCRGLQHSISLPYTPVLRATCTFRKTGWSLNYSQASEQEQRKVFVDVVAAEDSTSPRDQSQSSTVPASSSSIHGTDALKKLAFR